MPVMRCSNGKWKIGPRGKCVFNTYEEARKAWLAYLARKHAEKK